MIPAFELEGGTVLARIHSGLEPLISVTTKHDAVGFKARPRLRVYYPPKQITVTVDDSIEVMEGGVITDRDWSDLIRYIEINRVLLIELWVGEIDRTTYMNQQQAIDD